MRVWQLYTLQILVPEDGQYYAIDTEQEKSILLEAEENITDLLPARCEARIRRWDDATDEGTPK